MSCQFFTCNSQSVLSLKKQEWFKSNWTLLKRGPAEEQNFHYKKTTHTSKILSGFEPKLHCDFLQWFTSASDSYKGLCTTVRLEKILWQRKWCQCKSSYSYKAKKDQHHSLKHNMNIIPVLHLKLPLKHLHSFSAMKKTLSHQASHHHTVLLQESPELHDNLRGSSDTKHMCESPTASHWQACWEKTCCDRSKISAGHQQGRRETDSETDSTLWGHQNSETRNILVILRCSEVVDKYCFSLTTQLKRDKVTDDEIKYQKSS